MLGRISWWIVENVLWRAGLFNPPLPAAVDEPEGAREIASRVLAWKRCPICNALFNSGAQQLEFLQANPKLRSESYLVLCADHHVSYVTIFPLGTAEMWSHAQDEVALYLPKRCSRRTITYGHVAMFAPPRSANVQKVDGRCGMRTHDHSVFLCWYEKPGWVPWSTTFGVRE